MGVAGCAEVPSDVQKDIEKNEHMEWSQKETENPEIRKSSISDVVKNTPEIWKFEEGNIAFDGIVQVPDVLALHKWEVIISDNIYQKSEKTKQLFQKYFDNLEGSISYIYDEEEYGWFEDGVGYYDVEEISNPDGRTDELVVDEKGGLGMVMLTDYWNDVEEAEKWLVMPVNEVLPYEKIYYFNQEGKCLEGGNDNWNLYGRNIEVQQAMDCFLEFAKDYQSIEQSIEILPDRISAFKNNKQDCSIMTIHGMLAYEGVKVDDANLQDQPIKDYGDLCRLGANVEQIEFGAGNYPYWTKLGFAYAGGKKLETYDKIISFEDAWELLYGKIAKEKEVNMQRADLVYSIWYQPEGDTDQDWSMEMSAPPKMYATPVWRFISYQDAQTSYVYYVDAVTGEVTAYDHAVFN